MLETYHLSMTELEAGMEHIRRSPKDNGTVKMIVRRPQVDEREILQEAQITLEEAWLATTGKRAAAIIPPMAPPALKHRSP